MDENPTFTRHTDPDDPEVSWVTVDRWTPTALLAPYLINIDRNGGSIQLEGVVRIRVANGDAEYRVVGWSNERQALMLERVACTGPT